MSEKPSPKPSAAKSVGTPPGGAKSASKFKLSDDPDENFDFLARPQGRGELGRLAHYRVLKVLGKGGMGIVFMAEDTLLHRVVALKVMLPSIAKKTVARDRFIREARATAAIEHDHIVTIYEVSKEDSAVPYLAMQFLKGMTLEDWLKAGKTLNIPQIMRIGKEIAKALAAAHARQLIHRDIKPSNIWLDAVNKGRVKILDFGLARPTNEETHLTQEGMILGSPAYMSPEQARGADVDERVDLFSLGCVMYRLCAGRLPFAGRDAMSMLLEITSKEPAPVAQLNAELPPALAELVHQLLAKNPADRPASAKDVVQAIQDIERDWIATGKTTATRPVKPKSDASVRGVTLNDESVDVEPALEESAITELELHETDLPSVAAAPPRSRAWVLAALAGALLGVLSIFCCFGVVMATDKGFVKISIDDAARKQLGEASLTVRDHHNKTHVLNLDEPQRLPAGGYEVDAAELPRGLQIDPVKFSVRRDETQTITVTFKSDRPELVLITSEAAKKVQKDWAAYLRREVVETNSIGSRFVLIPPGEFLMGTTEENLRQHLNEIKKFDKKSLPDNYQNRLNPEKPQHRVRISKAFLMSANEVPFAQFGKFVAERKYQTEPESSGGGGQSIDAGKEIRRAEFNWKNTGFQQSPDHPACNITWKDAEAYCDWLSKKENKVYRLPTEAEWEYACRAGTTTLWYFGDDFREPYVREYLYFNLPTKFPKPAPMHSHPVGKKKENAFGLHDLYGNVAEMCADRWSPTYYDLAAKEPVSIDPKGPDIRGAKTQRVIRGGSFLDPPLLTRSAYRSAVDPALGYVTVGFRVVCEVPLPAE